MKCLIHLSDAHFSLWCGINGWWWGSSRRFNRSFLGKNAFDLFAFVVHSHLWNDNADYTQPLCCCHFGALNWRRFSHWFSWWPNFGLIICNNALCLDKSFFLCLASLFCFLSDCFARSDTFWIFLLCGGRLWSHLLINRRLRVWISHAVFLLNKLYLIEELPSNVYQLFNYLLRIS